MAAATIASRVSGARRVGVAHSPYFRSYLTSAKPGARLRRAPEGWYEFAGSLAVAGPYREPADIDRIERIAEDLDAKLDIVVV
jgi:hypothetical protein